MTFRERFEAMLAANEATERNIAEWRKGQTITGVFVDPITFIAEKRTISRSLRAYYELLDCDTIDVARRFIGGRPYEIVIDDEGALKQDHVVSAINSEGEPMLVGKLFVCKLDGEEELGSLDDDEIEAVLKHITLYRRGANFLGIALMCEYR